MQPTQSFVWKQAFENNRYRILFVDDHLFTLKSVQPILEGAGYIVYTAQTYDAAMEILKGNHIHLGIFDLNLDDSAPGDIEPENTEGLDLATNPDFPLIRVVYTGKKDTNMVVNALNHPGCVDYILKGQDSEQTLLEKVHVALTANLRINQDLYLDWHNSSLQEIVQTVYPELPLAQQMEHILELEDLFRMQFFHAAQAA